MPLGFVQYARCSNSAFDRKDDVPCFGVVAKSHAEMIADMLAKLPMETLIFQPSLGLAAIDGVTSISAAAQKAEDDSHGFTTDADLTSVS